MNRGAISFVSLLVFVLAERSAGADTTHTCVEAAHEGQSLRDSGKLSGARDAFVSCSAAACPALVRESCERWAAEIEPRVPTVVLGARDEAGNDLSDVRVSIDGKPLARPLDGRSMAVDPGPHEIEFEADGFVSARQFVVVREGEQVRGVAAVLARATPAGAARAEAPASDASARPSLVPLVVAGAVAGVGLGAFAVFGLWGKSDRDRLEDSCAPSRTCARADVRGVEAKYIVADVSLVVALAGAGVLAAYLIAPLFAKEPAARKAAVTIGAAPVQGGIYGGLTYGY